MKTAISVPDTVFKLAERAAKRLGLSRSELYTRALRNYLSAERDTRVTASYDEGFSDAEGDDLEEFRRAAAKSATARIDWSGE